MRHWLITGLLVLALRPGAYSAPLSGNSPPVETAKRRLEPFNELVGEWRGIGQERRGSNRGAWKQTGEFVWDFTGDVPAVRYSVESGKLTQEARFFWNMDQSQIECLFKLPDGTNRSYVGNWADGKLVLISSESGDGNRFRLTITPLNEKRTLVLHEKTTGTGEVFFRVAEVGYTRSGTRLALPGGVSRECIVTGGTGTIQVTYKGQTYYVCCSGCKQAFDDDPEGILADFKARLKERLENAEN